MANNNKKEFLTYNQILKIKLFNLKRNQMLKLKIQNNKVNSNNKEHNKLKEQELIQLRERIS